MIPFCHYQHTDCITSQVQSLNCCTIHHSCSPAFFSSSIFASLFSSGALPSPVSFSFCSEDDCVNSDNHDVTNERALLIAPPKKKNKESKYHNFLNSFDVFLSSVSHSSPKDNKERTLGTSLCNPSPLEDLKTNTYHTYDFASFHHSMTNPTASFCLHNTTQQTDTYCTLENW